MARQFGCCEPINMEPYLLPFRSAPMSDSAKWSEVLTPEECAKVIEEVENNRTIAQGHAGDTVNQEIRNNKISWIYSDPEDEIAVLLYEKIGNAAAMLNARFFRRGPEHLGFYEGIQYSLYRKGEHYKRNHMDRHSDIDKVRVPRILTITLQLSQPEDYEGGDLVLDTAAGDLVADRTQGTLIMFPSFIKHGVDTVTSGTRRALVAWIGGIE